MKRKIVPLSITLLIIMSSIGTIGAPIKEEDDCGCNDSFDDGINTFRSDGFIFNLFPAGDHFRFMIFDGLIRSYRIHIPQSYDGKTAVPLLIVLHGNTSNSKFIKTKTNFDERADKDGFIAVYPNGVTDFITALYFLLTKGHIARSLNGGFCCGNSVKRNIDDVGFIKTLIEKLQSRLNIDSSRIYATGTSNGGIMSYRLGAELSDIFAAIGVAGASIGGRLDNENSPYWRIPVPEHPLPVIIIHGMLDERVPYDGNARFDPVNDSVSFWVTHNNCDLIPERNISESGNIIRDTYKNGSEGAEVILYSVVNGTHAWYGSEGSDIQEISATDLVWEFVNDIQTDISLYFLRNQTL